MFFEDCKFFCQKENLHNYFKTIELIKSPKNRKCEKTGSLIFKFGFVVKYILKTVYKITAGQWSLTAIKGLVTT